MREKCGVCRRIYFTDDCPKGEKVKEAGVLGAERCLKPPEFQRFLYDILGTKKVALDGQVRTYELHIESTN